MSKPKPISILIFSFIFVIVISGFIFYIPRAQAAIPEVINYHGKLKDSGGTPLSGTYDFTFRFYDTAGGGTMSWGPETHNNVTVTNGYFNVQLGSIVSFDSMGTSFTIPYWLSIEVESDGEMSPRVPLTTFPYAFTAQGLYKQGEDIKIKTDTSGKIILEPAEAVEMITNNTSSGLLINQQGTGNILQLQDNGTPVLTVVDGGNVGIGTTNPIRKVDIHTESNNYALKFSSDSDQTFTGYLSVGAVGDEVGLVAYDDSVIAVLYPGYGIYSYGWDSVSGSNILNLHQANGFAGLGTGWAVPGNPLHIRSTTSYNLLGLESSTWKADIVVVDEPPTAGYDAPLGSIALKGFGAPGSLWVKTGTAIDAWEQVSTGGGSVDAFVQDGNAFGALATLGTNDNFGLAFKTNNIEKMRVLANGNVGIGTTNPFNKFHVNTASDYTIRFSGPAGYGFLSAGGLTGNDVGLVGEDDDYIAVRENFKYLYGLNWATWEQGVITIDGTTGNVGIGTMAPAAKLHIQKGAGVPDVVDTNSVIQLESDTNATNWWFNVGAGATNATLGFATDGNIQHALTYNVANDYLVLTNDGASGNPTTGLFVDTGGNVGIGTASPSASLDVRSVGNKDTLKIVGSDTAGTYSDLHIYKDGYWSLSFFDVASSAYNLHSPMFILRRARNTIASPEAVIQGDQIGGFFYRGYDGDEYLQRAGISAYVDGPVSDNNVPMEIRFVTGAATIDYNNPRMVIKSSGNVGIGTASPEYTLDVAGTAQMTGFKMPTGAGAGLVLTSDASGIGTWQAAGGGANVFVQDGNSFGALATLGTNDNFGLAFETNNIERMRIDTAGNVGIGTTSPTSSAILDLTSVTRGLLLPRMTTVQRDAISSPTTGLTIYNTTTNALEVYNGAVWGSTLNLWAENGVTLYPFNTSLDVAIGGTDNTAPFFVDVGIGSLEVGTAASAPGNASIAVGENALASSGSSIALGWATASGSYSVALGGNVQATNLGSVAIGAGTRSFGQGAVALGWDAYATGQGAVGTGWVTNASGQGSFTAGNSTAASGNTSAAFGYGTTAQSYASLVAGRYNIISGDANNWIATDPLFVIGNGTDVFNPANALTVLKNGNVGIGLAEPGGYLHIKNAVDANYSLIIADAAGNFEHTFEPGRVLLARDGGNVGIGTTNPGGGTGNSVLSLANSSAAPTLLADVTHLYSSAGEGYWMDAAGNTTLQTPHDPETGEWIFSSSNINTEKTLRVDMERLTKELDRILGGGYVFENGLPLNENGLLIEDDLFANQEQEITNNESGIFDGFVQKVKQALASLGLAIENGVVKVQKLIVSLIETENLKVGSPEKPTGITIYDEDTGQPYCIKMKNGQMISVPGECLNSVEQQPTEQPPACQPSNEICDGIDNNCNGQIDEENACETSPIDGNQPTEQLATEQPATEQTSVEQVPPEQTITEQPITEQPVTTHPSVEQQPTEETTQ